jgi:AraC-like DNA-binding protein
LRASVSSWIGSLEGAYPQRPAHIVSPFLRSVASRTSDGLSLAWRMAVAKDLLRRRELGIAEVAERIG